MAAAMQVGERVQVRAFKADGTCYRWWDAIVEAVEPDGLVLVSPAGHRVESPGGAWAGKHAIRGFYWRDRPYSLLEAYAADGALVEIYVNIGSPAQVDGREVRFTDYELDVSRRPPDPARLVDEDEFLEAAARYGYPEAFRRACYRAAGEAIELAARWVAKGIPAIAADSGRTESG